MAAKVKCNHPACDNMLYEFNISGVCKKHAHTMYCACGQCTKSGKNAGTGVVQNTCTVPGCGKPIRPGPAQVCGEHLHNHEHCKCGRCCGQRKKGFKKYDEDNYVVKLVDFSDPNLSIGDLCRPLSARVVSSRSIGMAPGIGNSTVAKIAKQQRR